MKFEKLLLACFLIVIGASPLAAQLIVTLTPNPAGPRPVGTTITWTANVSGDPDPNPVYEYTFSAERAGSPRLVRRGYGDTKRWSWTPSAFEGVFTVDTTVKNVHAGTSASASSSYTLTSRLSNGPAAVNPTNHPLVALFSATSCQVPNLMRVRFTPNSVPAGGNPSPVTTHLVACRYDPASSTPDRTSMNFYIAGMYPSTTYKMHWETVNPAGTLLVSSPDKSFTTGGIPSSLFFPTFSSTGMTGSPDYGLVLYSIVTIPDQQGHIETSSAVDLAGNIVWYSAPQAGAPSVPPVRTETGGNYLGFSNPGSTDLYLVGFRESDPAGNPILETTVGAINEQLVARGAKPITSIHHEVRRLTTPNAGAPHGYIMVIGNSERICTNCQGGTPQNPVDVLYDQIIVMDNNMNVVWNWDATQFLDIKHVAELNEKCQQPGGGGCEPFSHQFETSNDWLHSNSLQYEPYDGSIILSSRHQDAVFKINFANGTGDGHIIWELGNPDEPPGVTGGPGGLIGGPGGVPLPQFTLTINGAGGPDLGYPWFSHQHDPGVALRGQLFNGSRLFTVFDDGNTRQHFFNPTADSRCHELSLDETNLTANLNINGDEQGYSFALGSAQLLGTGLRSSISCDSGYVNMGVGPGPFTNTVETDASSNFIFSLNASSINYRSWRMKDLYTAVNP